MSPCPGRVHRWSLSHSPAALSAFPCNTPGRVHWRSLSRSLATSSPSPRAPRPTYTYGTLVARCFTGLSLPHPPRRAGQARPCGNTKPSAARFGTLFLSAASISRNPKPPSQTNLRHRHTDNAAHFGTSFLSVYFIGLSFGGLQNRPCRDC